MYEIRLTVKMDKADKRKVYYSMGEVTEMFDVNPCLIRFWESKFDILKPHRNNKGNRMFTPKDVDNLKLIYHLVKEKGMTLAGAQKRIKENPEGVSRDIEVIDRLMGIRSILLELRQELGMDGEEVYRAEQSGEENLFAHRGANGKQTESSGIGESSRVDGEPLVGNANPDPFGEEVTVPRISEQTLF